MLDGTDAVFLVGQTGDGKSLTLNFLAGREIVVVEDGFDHHLDVADILQCVSTVGHGWQTETIEPRAFHDAGSNLAFVDTPGFESTQGADADVVNAATLALAVRRPATVRLVVLISVKKLLASPLNIYMSRILPVLCAFLGDLFLSDLPKHQQSVLVFFAHCGDVPTEYICDPTGEAAFQIQPSCVLDESALMKKVAQRVTALQRHALSLSEVNDRDKSTQFAPIFLQHVLDLIGKHNELLFLQPTASETRAKVKQLILDTPPMDTSEVATHCPAQSRPAPSAPSLGSPPSPGVLHAQPTPLPRCH
jgi:hypothetical protein